jgi:hypothetical protein
MASSFLTCGRLRADDRGRNVGIVALVLRRGAESDSVNNQMSIVVDNVL